MLKLRDISFSVAGRLLIENANAVIPTGHKVGVVGRNGVGKTTLFHLIRGELTPETGRIDLPEGARTGGVSQEVPSSETSLLDTVSAADSERGRLMAEADAATDPARIADIQTRLADIDAWSAEARAASILRGLGFDPDQHAMPCSAFSGGWRMRVALAAALFSAPDLLLLDEPGNYLDLEGAIWLEGYLARYPHTVLVISHDRGLLNRAVGAILHLEDRKLTLYRGGYDTFAETRAARLATAGAEARKQETRRAHLQSYVDRFRYKATKARQAQSRLKMIARMKPVTRPEEAALRKFSFPEPEELSPPIVQLEGASAGYGGAPVLKHLDLRIDQDDRIALLGRNGEGKSTLSKLLSGRLQTMSGRISRANRLRIGYFTQHRVDELYVDETPLDHIRRLRPDEPPGRLRTRLGGFGIGAEQADTMVGRLSGGQKARLSLMLATLDAPHLLILDEPTNHLDIESREALAEALTAYSGAIILVSHDMYLLNLVADRLWLVGDGTVRPYDDDLDAYRKRLLSRDRSARLARPAPKPAAGAPGRACRGRLPGLRAEVRKCEDRLEKLAAMDETLSAKLADPSLYGTGKPEDIAAWQGKYAELKAARSRAEDLWMQAQEKLEAAEGRGHEQPCQ